MSHHQHQSVAGLTLSDIERREYIAGNYLVGDILTRAEDERDEVVTDALAEKTKAMQYQYDNLHEDFETQRGDCTSLRSIFENIADQIELSGPANLKFTKGRWEQLAKFCRRVATDPDMLGSSINDIEDLFYEGE